jgi:hypothetical protein
VRRRSMKLFAIAESFRNIRTEVKRPGCEAKHSPPCSDRINTLKHSDNYMSHTS